MYIGMLCGISIGVFSLILIIIGCLAIGVTGGYFLYKLIVQKKIDNATKSAKKIIEDAINDAKAQKKELIIEAKDEIFKLKADTDPEFSEIINLLKTKNIEYLNKELRNEIEQLKEKLDEQENLLIEKEEKIDTKANDIVTELERVAGLSQEQAKNNLMDMVREDARKAIAVEIRDMEEEAKWLASIDPNIVLHITRYFPEYHYHESPTSIELIDQMVEVAKKYLKNVYRGNC